MLDVIHYSQEELALVSADWKSQRIPMGTFRGLDSHAGYCSLWKNSLRSGKFWNLFPPFFLPGAETALCLLSAGISSLRIMNSRSRLIRNLT